MYGIPNYNELDPTFFLGITYLILFGAMFGDVGQGLVFIVIGFLLSPKKKPSPYGEILKTNRGQLDDIRFSVRKYLRIGRSHSGIACKTDGKHQPSAVHSDWIRGCSIVNQFWNVYV